LNYRIMRSRRLGATLTGASIALALGAFAAPAASAASTPVHRHTTVQPNSCQPDTWVEVDDNGVSGYDSIGSAVGKYNGSSSAGTLNYAMSVTSSRATAWTASASVSVGWGIAQIQAHYSYGITTTTSTGWTASDSMTVPAHQYGYIQPKVEYHNFHIWEAQQTASCGTNDINDYGTLRAIVVYPFFSECTSTGPCTPKP
jgi:hypothetical protein